MKLPDFFILAARDEVEKQIDIVKACQKHIDDIQVKIARGEPVSEYDYQKGCEMILKRSDIETYMHNIIRFLSTFEYDVTIADGDVTIQFIDNDKSE